jgi:hypothetical protein
MSPITHALLPCFFGYRWIPKNNGIPSFKFSGWLAFFGVLPDLLSPHLSLDARHASLSHSLTGWALFSGAMVLVFLTLRRTRYRLLAPLGVAAYAAHIWCDMITGGVSLFMPFSGGVYGGHHLPLLSWAVFDGALIFFVYATYRWLPLRRRIKRPAALVME